MHISTHHKDVFVYELGKKTFTAISCLRTGTTPLLFQDVQVILSTSHLKVCFVLFVINESKILSLILKLFSFIVSLSKHCVSAKYF